MSTTSPEVIVGKGFVLHRETAKGNHVERELSLSGEVMGTWVNGHRMDPWDVAGARARHHELTSAPQAEKREVHKCSALECCTPEDVQREEAEDDSPQSGRLRDQCNYCQGRGYLHHSVPHKEVRTCWNCLRFSTDTGAREAHEKECGCTWGPTNAEYAAHTGMAGAGGEWSVPAGAEEGGGERTSNSPTANTTTPMQGRRPARVYVASSWRNEARQQSMVRTLRAAGYEVYDFRNPEPGNQGFAWSAVDPQWQQWSPAEFRRALGHPVALKGFALDMCALRECDACVLVLPCGRSAHLELGWAAGAGKLTVVLLAEGEPELMLNMAHHLALTEAGVLQALARRGLSAGVHS